MTGGLGVGAIVTLRGDQRRDWWAVTGYDDHPGVGRLVHLARWVPDAWVRVAAGEPWWEYTETDTVRTAWWYQLDTVVFPSARPWQAGVA